MRRIRHAVEEDLPRIVEIYNASIPGRLATADTDPVTVESRIGWFSSHTPNKHPIWVLERNEDGIIGWISLRAFYGRPAYYATAEVSVYLDPKHAGKGHARYLLEEMQTACPQMGVHNLLAFVFGHNDPSLRVFERVGFEKWGHFPAVADLDGTWRDLVILGKKLIPIE